jgi:hypothetical protein
MSEIPIEQPKRRPQPDAEPKPELPGHPRPGPKPGIGEPLPEHGGEPKPPGPDRGE